MRDAADMTRRGFLGRLAGLAAALGLAAPAQAIERAAAMLLTAAPTPELRLCSALDDGHPVRWRIQPSRSGVYYEGQSLPMKLVQGGSVGSLGAFELVIRGGDVLQT